MLDHTQTKLTMEVMTSPRREKILGKNKSSRSNWVGLVVLNPKPFTEEGNMH